MAVVAPALIDPAARWRLSPDVSLRTEEFGALAYHHGNRRLIFLKSRALAELVARLGEYDSLDDAMARLVDEGDRAICLRSLSSLARSGIIRGD